MKMQRTMKMQRIVFTGTKGTTSSAGSAGPAGAQLEPRLEANDARGLSSPQAQPLRLLIATPRYFPFMGGVETHVYEVARRLATRGVEVTVLTTDPLGNLPADEQIEGVQIRRVRTFPHREDFYFAPAMYQVITRGNWDVVHCQGIHTFVPLIAIFAAWKAQIPYAVTFHTGGHSSPLRNAVRGVQWRILRPLLARAARLIGVSRFEAELFRKHLNLSPELFTVIPNGSNLPEIGAERPGSVDEALILSVGRLEKYKGHHRVIAALPHLLEQRPDVRLRIVGMGPYRDALQRLAEEYGVADKVQIGPVPATDRRGMAALLASASLVVLLSEYEAHPIAVMEALAVGSSVLAADTSGLSELAERGLIKAVPLRSTPREAASAILKELRAPHRPAQVDLPTWDNCAEGLLSVYRLIATPARKSL